MLCRPASKRGNIAIEAYFDERDAYFAEREGEEAADGASHEILDDDGDAAISDGAAYDDDTDNESLEDADAASAGGGRA